MRVNFRKSKTFINITEKQMRGKYMRENVYDVLSLPAEDTLQGSAGHSRVRSA